MAQLKIQGPSLLKKWGGTWVARLVKHLPSAQIMISGLWDGLPHVINTWHAEKGVCVSLCLFPSPLLWGSLLSLAHSAFFHK